MTIANAPTPPKPHTPANKKIIWLKRLLTLFFFILIPVLLFNLAKQIAWHEVSEALESYNANTLITGISIALFSYCVFASYDLIGKKYTHHSIPSAHIIPLGFVCYAFNLNLSSWVGGIALRYRLYSRLGLDVSTITKILSMSLVTNWLGYLLLAGLIFLLALIDLPANWKIGTTTLQLIGLLMLATALCYLVACKYMKRRSIKIHQYRISLPGSGLSLVQAGLAILNWSLMGFLIFMLLPDGKVNYLNVLGILLIAAMAGVITHIPAGLGVLETIFITLLQHQLSQGSVLAALIGYRVLYFLIPLCIAIAIYVVLEGKARKMNNHNDSPAFKTGESTIKVE